MQARCIAQCTVFAYRILVGDLNTPRADALDVKPCLNLRPFLQAWPAIFITAHTPHSMNQAMVTMHAAVEAPRAAMVVRPAALPAARLLARHSMPSPQVHMQSARFGVLSQPSLLRRSAAVVRCAAPGVPNMPGGEVFEENNKRYAELTAKIKVSSNVLASPLRSVYSLLLLLLARDRSQLALLGQNLSLNTTQYLTNSAVWQHKKNSAWRRALQGNTRNHPDTPLPLQGALLTAPPFPFPCAGRCN